MLLQILLLVSRAGERGERGVFRTDEVKMRRSYVNKKQTFLCIRLNMESL